MHISRPEEQLDHGLQGNNWHSWDVCRTAKTSKYGVYLSSWLDSSWLTENQLATPNGKKFVVWWKQAFCGTLHLQIHNTFLPIFAWVHSGSQSGCFSLQWSDMLVCFVIWYCPFVQFLRLKCPYKKVLSAYVNEEKKLSPVTFLAMFFFFCVGLLP